MKKEHIVSNSISGSQNHNEPWWEDPPLTSPFLLCGVDMANGQSYATIIDAEGRVLIHDQRAVTFVAELAKVMNENAERLSNAWKQDIETQKRNKNAEKGK